MSERARAELDRLVGWVTTDAGERVTLRPSDRVAFRYRDRDRVGTVLAPHRNGFRMREDGDATPKLFNREGVSGFTFLATGQV